MNAACLLWCHSGVSTAYVGERTFSLVAGDLLYAPEGALWKENNGGLVLDLRFKNIGLDGGSRRIHLGTSWGDRMVYEFSRSLFAENYLSNDIVKLFDDRVPTPPLPSTKKARAVAQILVANPADQTSLEDFAQAHGVAARTLQRQFLKTTSLSFSEWRAAQRVSVAASLLAHDFSISVTANLVGFAATSSLTRAFRRYTGSTPSAFTTGAIGMGTAGEPPAIPRRTTFAQAECDQQLWIYSGTATVTTPGYCRFLGQGDMATIPAATQTRIDVAAGSIALPVSVGAEETEIDLRKVTVSRNKNTDAGLTVLEEARWTTLSDELLNTPAPIAI